MNVVQMPQDYRLVDLTGNRFGKLVVTGFAGYNNPPHSRKRTQWFVKCDCGREKIVVGTDLKQGHTASCGCQNAVATSKRFFRHGLWGTPTHKSWLHMRDRCNNPRNKKYHRYGGRGITVCERWNDFNNFVSDMGIKPEGKRLSIHRKNNDGNYEPSNCAWANDVEQQSNTSRSRFITFNGETLSLPIWAKRLGVHYKTLVARLHRNPIDVAMTMERQI